MISPCARWWAEAKESALIGGLTLSTMRMDDEPITVHCILTAKLIQEVEALKAQLRESPENGYGRQKGNAQEMAE
jgi:hypothetical protein